MAEALRRRHHVTPLTSADVDATDASAVTQLVRGHDIGVGATRAALGHQDQAAAVTRALLDAHAAAGVRFLMVGGAGSLLVPGGDGQYVADDPTWVPTAIRALAKTAIDQLLLCRNETRADWTYLSPSALTQPGLRTGNYAMGHDELLIDPAGQSYISMEDLAVAVLDEIEQPQHRRERFTVGAHSH